MNFRRIFENIVFRLIEPPGAVSDGVVPSTYIDVSEFERFGFMRIVGTSNDTSVSMQVVQATSAAGAGSKPVTGAALSTDAVGSESPNEWAGVEVEQRKLDLNNGYRYVAVDKAATGGSATNGAILFIGHRGKYYPVVQEAAELIYVDG